MNDYLLVFGFGGAAGLSLIIASVSLWFCLSARQKLQQLRWDVTDRTGDISSLSEKFQTLTKQLEPFEKRFEELELKRASLLDFSTHSPAVNLSRRGQVLRLHRRGDSTSEIASALGLSEGEVRLTVTVQELILDKSDRESS